MKAKKSVYIFISLILTSIVLFLIALYIYDPLQVFHKHWDRKNTLSGNMRQQVVGMVNHYDYDSLILGSSQLENTSSIEASNKINGKFINISISGSDYYERSIVLKYILNKKKIKTIIYSLDNLEMIRKGHPRYPLETFDYLYDENPLNDFNVYLNHKYVNCLMTFSKETKCIGHVLDIDRPKAWYKKKHHKARFGGLENWFKGKNSNKAINQYKNISNIAKKVKNNEMVSSKNLNKKLFESQEYVNNNILKIIEKYPDTEFILILPPYPRLKFAMSAQYNIDNFKIYKENIKYIIKQSNTLNNLKLYGWEDKLFLDVIANYKDTGHYSHKINSWMLEAINREEGLLTISNVEEYLNIITKKATAFDLIGFGQKIDTYLENMHHNSSE